MLIFVFDTTEIISRRYAKVLFDKAYTTDSVLGELRCDASRGEATIEDFLPKDIEVRNPEQKYIEIAREVALEEGLVMLSSTDIEVAALALELTDENKEWTTVDNFNDQAVVYCVTEDGALKILLAHLDILQESEVQKKTKKNVCIYCRYIDESFENKYFCPDCGIPGMRVVSVSLGEDGKHQVHLAANHKGDWIEPLVLKKRDRKGKVQYIKIYTDGQREYKQYIKKNS